MPLLVEFYSHIVLDLCSPVISLPLAVLDKLKRPKSLEFSALIVFPKFCFIDPQVPNGYSSRLEERPKVMTCHVTVQYAGGYLSSL